MMILSIGNSPILKLLFSSVILVYVVHNQCVVDGFRTTSAFGTRGNFVHAGKTSSSSTTQIAMGMERIEFTIYPDGRVEELVVGVKGENCHKVNNFKIIVTTILPRFLLPLQIDFLVIFCVSFQSPSQLTRELNEKLGTVIDSNPTEEMFEQEAVLTNQQSINVGIEGATNDYGASW